VGPVGIVAWTGMRRRLASLVALTLVLGLTGAVVLASVAGSRRGRGALDEFLDFHRPGTIEAFVDPGIPRDDQRDLLRRMVSASGRPEDFASVAALVVALPGPDGVQGDGTDVVVADAFLDGVPLERVNRVLIRDGRLPLDPGEAAINDRLAARRGVEAGDHIDLAVFASTDLDRVGNGEPVAPLEIIDVVVGAVVRTPLDLARSPQAQPGTLFEADEGRVFLEPTFWAEHGERAASYGMGTSGVVPTADVDATVAAMQEVGGEQGIVSPSGSEDLDKIGPVGDAIDLEANALLALAAVVLVFGLAILGAALGRATGEDPEDRTTLQTLGLTRGQVRAAMLVRGMLVTIAATALAVAGAVAASGAFPIGLAADAEIHPGLAVDRPVLVFGGIAFAGLVALRLAVTSARPSRRVGRSSAGRLLPVTPAGLGARLAVDGLGTRGGSRSRVALATAMIGVAAVAGAATFAASLDRLVDSPARQGWNWDVVVGNFADDDAAQAARDDLGADPDVEAVSAYQWLTFEVDGRPVPLALFDAAAVDLAPVVLEGRAPTQADEVALGRGTLADLGKALGDTVEIRATGDPVTATVVGEIVAPATISTSMDLDSGGSATFGLAEQAFIDTPGAVNAGGFLVALDGGADHDAAIDRLREDFPGTVLGPMKPLDVSNLQRVRGVPYLLAGLLGAMALTSVGITLAASSRRRRRDVAVLRALGLARSQLRLLVAGEATAFVLLVAALGLPLGIVAGRLAWRAAADGLGSEVGPVLPGLAILGATLGVLLLVNLYGQALAVVVGRRRPGGDLRSE
jgi:hypothetical protein